MKETTVETRLAKLVAEHLPAKLREIEVGDVSPAAGMKRKSAGAGADIQIRPIKRQKKAADLSYIAVGVGDDDEYEIDEDIVLRVNYDKFMVLFRNDELIELAKDRMGETTSLVYKEVLKALESKILRCHDPIQELAEEQGKREPPLSSLGYEIHTNSTQG
jgi:DNA-directed RNA polymerase III subunit RPC3